MANEQRKKRRGRGEGGIRYRADADQWEARISFVVRRADGSRQRQRPTVTGETKKEVQGKLDELRRRHAVGGEHAVRADRLSLDEWAGQWLEVTRAACAPNTFIQYEQHVRLYLRPLLGSATVGRLTVHKVELFLARLTAAGASPSLARAVARTLSVCLGHAVRHSLIAANPVRMAVKPSSGDPRRIKAYTQEETGKMLLAARGRRLFALLLLLFDAGLRQEEAFALEWADLDMDAGTVAVTKALEEVPPKKRASLRLAGEGRFRVKETKTAGSRRTIPLDTATVQALREHKVRMEEEGHGAHLAFPAPRGGFLAKDNFRRRVWETTVAAAGVPNYGPNSTRHTCATLLLKAGVDVKTVAERLGHSTPVLVLTTYGHVLKGMQAAATTAIGGVLRQALADADRHRQDEEASGQQQ